MEKNSLAIHPENAHARLRFAVLSSGSKLFHWQAKCLQALLDSRLAELSVFVDLESSQLQPSQAPNGLVSSRKSKFFGLYEKLATRGSQALRLVNLSELPSGADYLLCRSIPNDRVLAECSDEDLAKIRSYDLDFILSFVQDAIHEEILASARYGVWSFSRGGDTKSNHGPVGFWEIYENDPITSATLRRSGKDRLDGVILYGGSFPTIQSSWTANRDQALLGAAEWPATVCRSILHGGFNCLTTQPSRPATQFCHWPTGWQTVKGIMRMAASLVKRHLRELILRDQWHIGIVRAPIHAFLEPDHKIRIEWLPVLPRTRFFADPFAIKRGTEVAILFEDFDQLASRGVISAIRSTDNGRTFSAPLTVTGGIFNDGHIHKSYPYLLQRDGEIFCVPEALTENEIALYRAVQFPERWERVCTLVEGIDGIDPTLFQYQERWWMFYTTLKGGSNVRLFLASAPELEGPWSTHPANPIKTDIRGARPGGTPFVHNGVLYRPAQDSTLTYGGSLAIYRVHRLTPFEYEESLFRRISPDRSGRYSSGFHTLAAAGDISVVDGKRTVAIPELLTSTIKSKIHSVLSRMRTA